MGHMKGRITDTLTEIKRHSVQAGVSDSELQLYCRVSQVTLVICNEKTVFGHINGLF